MNEKTKILEMLKEGKISVEDSLKLMEAIEEPIKETPKKSESFTSKLSELIEDITENVTKAVEGVAINLDFEGFNNRDYVDSNHFIFTDTTPEVIESLKLKGKNGTVKVEGYHGSVIEIRGDYKTRIGKTADIKLIEENSRLELDYDPNAVKYLSIEARIPNVFINEIDVFSTNANICVEDITAKDIYAKTSNSGIAIENTQARLLDLNSSNGKISVEDTKAEKAKISTSNSSIKLEGVYITETNARTSNGKISIEYLEPIDTEAIVDAQTSNSSIVVEAGNTALKFRASTSNGRITTEGIYNFLENSKTFVEAVNPNFDEAMKKVKINLSTSNGNIKIK